MVLLILLLDVKIVESSFISSDVRDPAYEEVSTVIVEPPNSGTAIIDKLGYLLQEEGTIKWQKIFIIVL